MSATDWRTHGTTGSISRSAARRRRHSAEFKAAVIQDCMRPGISVAAVALAHNPNANMLREWVIEAEHKGGLPPVPSAETQSGGQANPAFVSLSLASPGSAPTGEIQIELQRAGATVKISWPTAAAHECAAWLRDWLR